MSLTATAKAGPHSPAGTGPGPDDGRGAALRRTWRKASPYAYITPFFTLFLAFGPSPLLYTAFVSLYRVELPDRAARWSGGASPTTRRCSPTSTSGPRCATRSRSACCRRSRSSRWRWASRTCSNYKLRGRTFVRTAILLPYATSVAAATLVFAQLFGKDFGLINYVIGLVGFDPVDWQTGTVASQIAVSTIVIWRWTGYNALIYLAGMQSIPHELYEAARWTGPRAGGSSSTSRCPVCAPRSSSPSSSRRSARRSSSVSRCCSRGRSRAVSRTVQTLGLYMYEQGWGFFHLGRAAAIAWVMFVLIVVLVGVNALIARRRARKEPGR
ncbi:ABC transporter permease [Streptomyces badius]